MTESWRGYTGILLGWDSLIKKSLPLHTAEADSAVLCEGVVHVLWSKIWLWIRQMDHCNFFPNTTVMNFVNTEKKPTHKFEISSETI